MTSPSGLHSLARLHGVQTAYENHDGQRVTARPEALMAVLRALGVPVHGGRDVRPALERRWRELWERVVEPVVVAWLEETATFTVRVPAAAWDASLRVTARLEEGGERSVETTIGRLELLERREVAGRELVAVRAPLPKVPAGYHELRVEIGAGRGTVRHRARLLAAPRRIAGWETLPGRPWGVFAPLYALWEDADPGRVPHFGLLDRLAEGVATLGGSVVGTLPLLASFLDRPYEPSPYAPVSRLFWNELYVDDAAELGRHGTAADGRMIDARAAMAARRRQLGERAREYFSEHADADTSDARGLRVPQEMAAFVARNPLAPDYARFRALTEFHGPWPGWPDRLRARDVRPGDYDADVAGYHLFAQWQAERELAKAEERAAARGVGLYLDLPLGVHPAGYDVWRERELFATDATVGAPPDPLAPQGQDWGFHPPDPETSRLDGHRYFTAAIRSHLRFARVLRVDHVMQLHRMFWVPGGAAADGVYVRYPHEELYAILSLESHRSGSVIVGEDLGTVPRAVRRSMARHGMPGTYVVQFSLRDVDLPRPAPNDAEGHRAAGEAGQGDGEAQGLVPGRVPRGALAAIGTHDTPMFAAWWTGRDAEIRAERGLMDAGEARQQVDGRSDLRAKLARGLEVKGGTRLEPGAASGRGAAEDQPGTEAESGPGSGGASALFDSGVAAQEALYRFLGGSEAGLVLATLEDVWMETEPQNVPGTPSQENWRRRTRRPLESMTEDVAARLLKALNEARKGSA